MDIKMDLSASSPESDDFKVRTRNRLTQFFNEILQRNLISEIILRYASFVTIEQPAITSMQWHVKVAKDSSEERLKIHENLFARIITAVL